jgi:XRE family transcriptional regulator, regulator of sulfur utilization
MKTLSAALVLLVIASTSYARAPQAGAAPAGAPPVTPKPPVSQPPAPQPSATPPTAGAPAAKPSAEGRLVSSVFGWNDLPVEARPNGVRRAVLDGPTQTLDKLHAHVTTLNPGQTSGDPRLHEQEEVIIVKEGTIEARFDGQKRQAGPGSIIFFAANAVTSLANVGSTPATYYVVYFYTPLTPKPAESAGGAPR